jgi:hypothetical protein
MGRLAGVLDGSRRLPVVSAHRPMVAPQEQPSEC